MQASKPQVAILPAKALLLATAQCKVRARRARDLDGGTDVFKNSDEDRDNRLSEEEFENFNRRNGERPADDNQEGAVSRDFSKHDQNRDGRLTTDEAIVVPEH